MGISKKIDIIPSSKEEDVEVELSKVEDKYNKMTTQKKVSSLVI